MFKSFSDIISTYKELEKLPEKIKERVIIWCKSNHINHRIIHNLFTENFLHAKYSPQIRVKLSVLYESRSIVKEEVPLEIVKQENDDLEKKVDIWDREYFPPAQYIDDSFYWMLPKIFEMKSCTYCGKIDPACRYCKGGGKIALVENVKVDFSPEFHQNDFSDIDDKVFLSNLTSPLKIFETESDTLPETYNLSEKYIDLVKICISKLNFEGRKLRRIKIEVFILPVIEIFLVDDVKWYIFGEDFNFFVPDVNSYKTNFIKPLLIAGLIGLIVGSSLFFMKNKNISPKNNKQINTATKVIVNEKNKMDIAVDFLKKGNLLDAATTLSTTADPSKMTAGMIRHIESFYPKDKFYSPEYCFMSEMETGLWPVKIYFLDGKIESVDFYSVNECLVINSKLKSNINGYKIKKLSLSKIEIVNKNNKIFNMSLPLNRGIDKGISFIKQLSFNKKLEYNNSFTVKTFQILKPSDPTQIKNHTIIEVKIQNSDRSPWSPNIYLLFYKKPPSIDAIVINNIKKAIAPMKTERIFLNCNSKISDYKFISVLTWKDISKNRLINNRFYTFINSLKKYPVIQNNVQKISFNDQQIETIISTSDQNKTLNLTYSIVKRGSDTKFFNLIMYNSSKETMKSMFIPAIDNKITISHTEPIYYFSIQ